MKSITYDDTLYQLVPKEANERIKRAIFVMLASADDEGRFYRKVIEMASSEANSMLSAAPTPPAQPVKPLTEDEIFRIRREAQGMTIPFARGIEAAHGIKE